MQTEQVKQTAAQEEANLTSILAERHSGPVTWNRLSCPLNLQRQGGVASLNDRQIRRNLPSTQGVNGYSVRCWIKIQVPVLSQMAEQTQGEGIHAQKQSEEYGLI